MSNTNSSVSTQQKEIIALKKAIQASPPNRERIALYRKLKVSLPIQPLNKELAQYAAECMAFGKKTSLLEAQAVAYEMYARVAQRNAQFQAAIDYTTKAKELYKQLGKHLHIAYCMMEIANFHSLIGLFNASKTWSEQAVAIANKHLEEDEALSNEILICCYFFIGQAQYQNNDFEAAGDSYNTALQYCSETEQVTEMELHLIVAKAVIVGVTGDIQDCIPIFLEVLQKAKSLQLPSFEATALISLARTYQSLGHWEQVIHYSLATIKIVETYPIYKDEQIRALVVLGFAYKALKDSKTSLRYFQQAKSLADKHAVYSEQINSRMGLIRLYTQLNELKKAAICTQEGIAIATAGGDIMNELSMKLRLADLHIASGTLTEAATLYQQVAQQAKWIPLKMEAEKGLGDFFYLQKEYTKALTHTLAAYNMASKENKLGYKGILAESLANLYELLKDIPQAYAYLKIAKTTKEANFNEKIVRNTTAARLNAQFEKEKEILALQEQQKQALLEAEREKNQAIAKKNAQLEQVNIVKDHIFAIIGHDLRKPAIAFRGIAKKVNYLLKKQDYATLLALGTDIEKDAFALSKLTDNLLNWALMQKNIMPYQPKPIPVIALVEDIKDIYKNVAAQKNIQLQTNIDEQLQVYADYNALHTIVRNLVDNALKYTPYGGTVTLTTTTASEGIAIQVSDTGVGIAENKLRDIFLLQKDKSQKGTTGEKGTGLGLHLVHELTKLNKGNVRVMSQVGQGTCFEVWLPAA